jgi:hypothetical protein
MCPPRRRIGGDGCYTGRDYGTTPATPDKKSPVPPTSVHGAELLQEFELIVSSETSRSSLNRLTLA